MSTEEVIVRSFIEAFNNHDVGAMATLVDENMVWLSVQGDSVLAEASGREELVRQMEGYFATAPSIRSEAQDLITTGSFVSFRERVYWEGDQGEQTQASLAVYEIREGLIVHVWYYPAVP